MGGSDVLQEHNRVQECSVQRLEGEWQNSWVSEEGGESGFQDREQRRAFGSNGPRTGGSGNGEGVCEL